MDCQGFISYDNLETYNHNLNSDRGERFPDLIPPQELNALPTGSQRPTSRGKLFVFERQMVNLRIYLT